MTYYSFKPDYKELVKSAEDFFEDDFEDDDLEKEFEKALDEVKQHKDNFAIRVKIGIEDVGETSIDEEILQSYIKTPSITAKPTDKPVVTAKPTRTPKLTQIIDVKVGGYIKFGEYKQDNNPANGKENIEWIVLEKKDDKALVVSKVHMKSIKTICLVKSQFGVLLMMVLKQKHNIEMRDYLRILIGFSFLFQEVYFV